MTATNGTNLHTVAGRHRFENQFFSKFAGSVTVNGRKVAISKYTDIETARRVAQRGYDIGRPQWIVQGDNHKLWLVRPVDAGYLENNGFEIVK